MPKVSVLMPVHNQWQYIPFAIKSILRQSESDFEFVIIDDASNHITQKILTYSQRQDKRIRLYRNDQNIGLTKSLNLGLDLIQGEYIMRMDADDISHPQRLVKQLHAFQDNIGLVSCWAQPISILGRTLHSRKVYEYKTHLNTAKATQIMMVQNKNAIIDPSVIFHRSVFDKIGYYDTALYIAQSYNYTLRTLQFFALSVVPEVLYYRRKHRASTSKRFGRNKNIDWAKKCRDLAVKNPIITTP